MDMCREYRTRPRQHYFRTANGSIIVRVHEADDGGLIWSVLVEHADGPLRASLPRSQRHSCSRPRSHREDDGRMDSHTGPDHMRRSGPRFARSPRGLWPLRLGDDALIDPRHRPFLSRSCSGRLHEQDPAPRDRPVSLSGSGERQPAQKQPVHPGQAPFPTLQPNQVQQIK
jgi:hypothetical protein